MDETVETTEVNEIETRAKGMGWIPKEDFRGDLERWRPAEEFVARADELMPVMKAQNRKYEEKISHLEQEIQSAKQTMQKMAKISEKMTEEAYKKAKSDIVKAQAEAVASGDSETWQRLETEKESLSPPEKIEVETQSVGENPAFKSWHKDNDWYLSDPAMTRYANAYAAENQNTNIPYNKWLGMVEEAVKEAFPHKFKNPARDKAAAVDGSETRSSGGSRSKTKGYNDLPSDAKIQCEKYVAQGLLTKEQYIKDFFEEA